MTNTKACTVIVALATSGLLLSTSAQAQGYVTIDQTWTFDDASGSCDTFFTGGCSLDNWFTGGRAGWQTVNTSGFLWLSNDASWNSWNTEFSPSGWNATNGECNITASVFSTDDVVSSVGELDLWEMGANGLIPLSVGNPITGTAGQWATQTWDDIPIDQAVNDHRQVLMVLGRHQGQGQQQFIALDNVSAYCWVYDTP